MDHLSLPLEDEHAPPPVAISALQHYMYCPRQCALIHLEQEFADNTYTARGKAVHALVDKPGAEMRGDMRVERALPLYSRALGLVGKAEAVEFRGETPYQVEYKNGPRGALAADEVQLAAQALCLEEMTGQQVPEGAIYRARFRRRRRVPITRELRKCARDGYGPKAVADLLSISHGAARRLMRGLPPPGWTQELQAQVLKAGLPL
jgi:CRISPR-associated exonuclease Cas4